METYQEMKQRHSKEIDFFQGLFFAFNHDQLAEGMEKIGLTIKDIDKIYSLGAGGYVKKTESEKLEKLFEKHAEERKELRKNKKIFFDSLVYELRNHEYCISRDFQPALDALGISEMDVEPKLLSKACKLAK
jgi:hypothetical protein